MFESLPINERISSKQDEKNSTRVTHAELAIGDKTNKTNPQQTEFNRETSSSQKKNENSSSTPVEKNCDGFIEILLKKICC